MVERPVETRLGLDCVSSACTEVEARLSFSKPRLYESEFLSPKTTFCRYGPKSAWISVTEK